MTNLHTNVKVAEGFVQCFSFFNKKERLELVFTNKGFHSHTCIYTCTTIFSLKGSEFDLI